MRILLLSPSGSTVGDVASVLNAAGDDATLTVVGYATGTLDRATAPIVVRGSRPGALTRALRSNAIGRVLLRLSPWDAGRVFARAVGSSAEATAAAREADLIVACERDAILATWNLARVPGSGSFAARGIAAAVAHLQARAR